MATDDPAYSSRNHSRGDVGRLRSLTLTGVRDGEAGGMFQPLFSIIILCSSSGFGAHVAVMPPALVALVFGSY